MSQELKGAIGKELTKILLPGEEVLDFAQGTSNHAIVATTQRVIVLKSAMSTGGGFGGTIHAAYLYQQISSVQVKADIMSHYVEIGTSSQQNVQLGPVGRVKAMNVVSFRGSSKADFARMVSMIQQRMAAVGMPSVNAAPASLPEQIGQLAVLRDQGIITEEEFTTKKANLLARI